MKMYRLTTIIILSLMQINRSSSLCGQLQPTMVQSLVGAHRTHRWPWHVAIYLQVSNTSSNYHCGGTLITSSSVLTAAHCVNVEARLLSVSLGRLNLNASDSVSPFIKVAKAIRHPDFISENCENDIAIVTLAKNAIFNNYVQPVCLWKADKTDLSNVMGKSGTVVGWGKTETKELSSELREVSLSVVDSFTCLRSNRDLYGRYLTDTNYCAGFRNGSSVCEGDSGGSMVFKEDGTYHIRGIVSVSATVVIREDSEYVCDPNQYAIFTDVAKFLPWIEDNVAFEYESGVQCLMSEETSSCGRLSTTRTHHWPWHAAIYHRYSIESDPIYQCGGTVIGSKFVLTAAHCVNVINMKLTAANISVSLGRTNLGLSLSDESTVQSFEAAEIIVHQDYNTVDFLNDIAIIKLSAEAQFNNYVKPACLWSSSKTDISEAVGKNGTVVGWGITESGQLSMVLRQHALPVVSWDTCLASNLDAFGHLLSKANYCAGSRNGTTVCMGDTGGAMTFEENGKYYIRGILSNILSRPNRNTLQLECDSSQYALFTDVAKYLTWIRDKIC